MTVQQIHNFHQKILDNIHFSDVEMIFLASRTQQILFNSNIEKIKEISFKIENKELSILILFKNDISLQIKLIYKNQKTEEILFCDAYVSNQEYFLDCSMFRKIHYFNEQYNFVNPEINLVL